MCFFTILFFESHFVLIAKANALAFHVFRRFFTLVVNCCDKQLQHIRSNTSCKFAIYFRLHTERHRQKKREGEREGVRLEAPLSQSQRPQTVLISADKELEKLRQLFAFFGNRGTQTYEESRRNNYNR